MAINTKKKRVQAAKDKDFPGSTTHFPNETTKPEETSDQAVKNQQDWNDLLHDPDFEPGNTHFRNDQTYNDKSNKNAVSATTTPKKKKSKATAAEVNVDEDEASGYTQDVPGPDEDATFGPKDTAGPSQASTKVKAGDDCGPQATTHSPNGEDVEPADGYIMVGELSDLEGDDMMEDGEDEEFEDEEEVDADALEDDAGQNPQQSLLDVTEEHEVDAEFDDFEEPVGEPNEVEDLALEEEGEEELEMANVDDMAVLDVDGTDDEGDDAVFASVGMKLHVIKANRIVASMTKKAAIKAGHEDMYLSDEFQDACYVDFKKFGLRAGLNKMGFVLAKINVAKSEVVNKRVEAKAKKVTAAIRRTTSASNEALGQCLAIAAVGINRQYFKDTRNELRATLEAELESAGVRGASKMVRRIFASHGVDYAKAILTLANKLVTMPEETRNAFAAALDMTTDGEIETDEDLYGDPSSPDFQSEDDFEVAGDFDEEDDDEGFVDEFEAEDEAPETIHAALTRPIHRREKSHVTAKSVGYSVTAQAVLNGKAELPFLFTK